MSTNPQTARERLRDGITNDHLTPKDVRRLRSQAETYAPNEDFERLLKRPELLDRLPPSVRMQLGMYEESRAAAIKAAIYEEHAS